MPITPAGACPPLFDIVARCPDSHPAAQCAILIRRRGSSLYDPLNLGEVELYTGANFTRVAPSLLNFIVSSTPVPQTAPQTTPWAGPACNDGNTTTLCHTLDPASGDPSPWLRIDYPCLSGSTSVSRVVVYNRPLSDPSCISVCSRRILVYALDFLDATGQVDRQSFDFTEAVDNYTIYAYPTGEYSELSQPAGRARHAHSHDRAIWQSCCSWVHQSQFDANIPWHTCGMQLGTVVWAAGSPCNEVQGTQARRHST